MPDGPRKPLTPRGGTHVGDRGEVRRPRQDDAPAELAVPVEFDQPITGVYHDPILELRKRAERIQHLTEGGVTAAAAFDKRLTAVETGLKDLGTKQEASEGRIVKILEGQNQILPDLVEMAKMKRGEDHAMVLAQVEVNRGVTIDQVDATRSRREQIALVLKIVAAALGVAAAAFAAGRC